MSPHTCRVEAQTLKLFLTAGNSVGPQEVKNFIQVLKNEGEQVLQLQEQELLKELGLLNNSSRLV